MPIKRFADELHRTGKTEVYMKLLIENFNPAAANGVMCRDLVSVSWDGKMYDCDFNQQLDLPMPREKGDGGGGPLTVFDVDALSRLTGRRLAVDNHCFGCTAGAGSSCSGATA